MRRFLASIIRNTVFANVLLIVVILLGALSAFKMTREFFPEFSTDIVQVLVPFPGADPEDVEESISRKIEEGIEGLDGIKRYTTRSAEGVGMAFIEVQEGYPIDEVKDRVSNAVDGISTFPVDAEKPTVSEIIVEQEVAYLALWGDLSEKQLKEWAERTKDELQAKDDVSKVRVLGARDYEIGIGVSEERLREYGLTFDEVAMAVRRGSLNLAGGTIRSEGEEIRIRTMGRNYTGAEFASVVVKARPNGEVITLDRIATIRDEFVEDPVSATFNGAPCIILSVVKTEDEDAIAIAADMREFVDSKNASLPETLHVTMWSDRSVLIEARINVLVRNGLIGLTIVFIMLWMFLDLRLSFWVGMGIPVSLSGALALMWAIGATINMISLFGLIMVLGIIVDDAIVIGEAIYVHRKSGEAPLVAAVNGVREVGLPVLGAVTTTIVAFLPLFFISGIMGKFIGILPVVVICALATSLIEGFFLLPAHLNHLPELNGHQERGHPWKNAFRRMRRRTSNGMEWFVEHVYGPLVAFAIRWRYVTVSISVAVMLGTIGMFQGGFIKFVFFPRIDGNDLVATVEFPRGTPFEVTQDAVDRTVSALHEVASGFETASGDPMIRNIYAVAGQVGVVNSDSIVGGLSSSGSHIGEVRVEMLGTEERGIHFEDINLAWEKTVGSIPGAVRQSFTGMEAGPPGAAIEIWLLGHDMDQLLGGADMLKAKLGGYDGVYQVADDFRRGKNEVRFRLKPEATVLGVTVDDLARQVNSGYFGKEALRIQRGRDDVRVKVRYTEEERRSVADLEHVRIRTARGGEVPILSVADVSFAPGYSTIVRVDGMREVAVTAEVDPKKANTAQILQDLSKSGGALEEMEDIYRGVMWRIEGREKENSDALGSIKISYPIALFAVFVIIATIFRSYVQPLVIMVTVPYGIVGAVWGHWLLGYDLTMLSLFGVVALSGVVVNDAIVLIERVNGFIAEGMPFFEALRRGGMRRFRAIFLTTVSTCGGLTPLIMERDLQAQFLIPMALSIAAGVAFATLLTLFLVPCLLGVLNDLRRAAHWLRHGTWPTPEEVEPSRDRYVDLLDQPGGDGATPAPATVGK
jgi:multidrug efflux pump subunit AcrB